MIFNNKYSLFFVKAFSIAFLLLPLSVFATKNNGSETFYDYCLPQKESYDQNLKFAEGSFSSFGWNYIGLTTNKPVELIFSKPEHKFDKILFRFTSAIWLPKRFRVELYLLKSKKIINSIEVWNTYFLQPFEIEIEDTFVQQIFKEGVGLRPVGLESTFFIYADNDKNIPVQFKPALLYSRGSTLKRIEIIKRMTDVSTLQFFGWPEGCLWDCIYDLGEVFPKIESARIIQGRLNYFKNDKNNLDYLIHHNIRLSNEIFDVETILPFGVFSKFMPNDTLVKQALNFCLSQMNENGIITHNVGEDIKVKTEENYTVSYPLLLIAKNSNNPQLVDIAVKNLLYRKSLLSAENGIYHRKIGANNPIYLNWARGTTWYLLGLAKSLKLIPRNHPKYNELLTEFQTVSSKIARMADSNGMYRAFLHDKSSFYDTSGTSGITAAFAYGVKNDFLSQSEFSPLIKKSINELLTNYVTPDGYLRGSTQINNGGEELQSSDFRTISPYTLGFVGMILSCGY